MTYLPTGVADLDIILGGGVPEAYLVFITGAPGTGKTVLVHQIAFHLAKQGTKVLYVTALSEPHTKLVAHLSGFSFFDRALLGDRVKIINVLPVARHGLGAITGTIVRTLKDERINFLIFDGFRSLRDFQANEREVRAFSYELAGTLSSISTTSLFTSDLDPTEAQDGPEMGIADGLISLAFERANAFTRRTLDVMKMRGARPLPGPHSMDITDDGVTVYPRPERVFQRPAGRGFAGRASFGIEELDDMCGGGLPKGTSTVVMGDAGSGKTWLGLQFAVGGLQSGEKTVIVRFRETAEDMVRTVGLGDRLAAGLDEGGLHAISYWGGDLDPDRVVWDIWRAVAQAGASRVVIDDVEMIERVVPPERWPGLFTALTGHLQANGIAVCIARRNVTRGDSLLDLENITMGSSVENVILLRSVEHQGELMRTMLVMKMRHSPHDRTVREYTIGEQGLRLGGRYEGPWALSDVAPR